MTNFAATLKLCFCVIDNFFVTGLAFYDWESQELIRRIEIQPKNVYWSSENGAELVCISTEVSFIKVSTTKSLYDIFYRVSFKQFADK